MKWANYDSSQNAWVCACNVGKAAISDYKAGRKIGSVGKKSASLAEKIAGDFNIPTSERKELEALACNTFKEQHSTSAGILALVSSCGLFLAAKEIFGSESLTQVHLFLFEAFFVHGLKDSAPQVFAYDDACHLLKFLKNRVEKSIFAHWLLKVMKIWIVCDRFHFPNHKDPWCKKHVDPAKCKAPAFSKANTQAAEQAFSWLAGAKHLFRHMNEARFFFQMLRMMHLRNQWLCQLCVECDTE